MFYFIVLLVPAIFVFLNRKRVQNKFFYLALLILLILMGGNTNNPDTVIYYNIYYNTKLFTKDILFGWIVFFSKWIGLTYNQFRFVICLLGLSCIYSTVFKFTKKPAVFTILYVSFPLFYDAVQLRNFLGISVFVFCIPYLLEKSIWKKCFSVLGIVASILIQKTHLTFLVLLLFALLISKNKIFRYVFLFCSLVFSFAILHPTVTDIVTKLLYNTDLEGIEGFTIRVTRWGWLYKYLLHLVNCLILWCIRVRSFSHLDVQQKKFFSLIYYLNLASTMCLFLYVINPTYARIIRNIMILNFILISAYFGMEIKFNSKKYKVYESCVLFGYCVFIFAINYLVASDALSDLVINLFQNNWIIFGTA